MPVCRNWSLELHIEVRYHHLSPYENLRSSLKSPWKSRFFFPHVHKNQQFWGKCPCEIYGETAEMGMDP
jgi:hypothetical protein